MEITCEHGQGEFRGKKGYMELEVSRYLHCGATLLLGMPFEQEIHIFWGRFVDKIGFRWKDWCSLAHECMVCFPMIDH
jgi:hypothetical protein